MAVREEPTPAGAVEEEARAKFFRLLASGRESQEFQRLYREVDALLERLLAAEGGAGLRVPGV